MLKEEGYYTAGVGKWHLGLGNAEKTDYTQPLTPGPNAHGFDYYFGIPASLDMQPYLYFENEHTVELPTVAEAGREYAARLLLAGGIARTALRHPASVAHAY